MKIWGALVFLFCVAVAFEATTLFRNIPSATHGSTVVFVRPGHSLHKISRQLVTQKVLKSSWKLRLLARITGNEKTVQPGEYRFDLPTPPWNILRNLSRGKVLLHKVTIPEGYGLSDIAKAMANADLSDEKSFQSLFFQKDLLDRLEVPAKSFEGFLFPDTYLFSKTDGEIKILETMVNRLRQSLTIEDQQRAKELDFSLLEWITLASIIEKESTHPDEQPLVSSVFHNRLKKRMRLQSDPTVIYGIKNFNGNLTRKDLETTTPYNTYRMRGLPPGPIASPGATAIHAAVNPAKTDYLYFVGDRKGRHVFTKSYKEHLEAVRKYQLRRRS